MSFKKYIPAYYGEIREMEAIAGTQGANIDVLNNELQLAVDNQFVLTANSKVISIYEELFQIKSVPTAEDLSFRRQRVLNRLKARPPFTERYLKERLVEMFGEGNFELYIDYNKYQLKLESSVSNYNWFKEAEILIREIKPANIEYIQAPLLVEMIKLVERASVQSVSFFRVGISVVGNDKLVDIKEENEVSLY